jgi:hypothetical protein
MAKVPFKVSARTARLIGRENIATSKGAIIELVKNSSDADSKVSIIYFDNKYAEPPAVLSHAEYEDLKGKMQAANMLEELYIKDGADYVMKPEADQETKISFKNELRKTTSLYLIDAGEGMTQQIIMDYWMTIGTDNKAQDVFTKSGRVKAGAKGIGRFALDKLGDKCEMITKFNPKVHKDLDTDGHPTPYAAYKWIVNWRDFEGQNKTIDLVKADLEGMHQLDMPKLIREICPLDTIGELVKQYKFTSGTILKISDVREDWVDFFIDQLFADLQVLVPPEEGEDFKIYLYTSVDAEKYGLVEGSVCDDYDYKLVAVADENQNVTVTIYRNEYDLDIINRKLFEREAMKIAPYTKDDFRRGYWTLQRSFAQLIPGFQEVDEEHTFEKIGTFHFTLYFMKRTYSSNDLDKFNYKKFASNERKDWLKKYGGIKLFRDNFRVRPYGEISNSAFDWLGLGTRKSKNPAAVSKLEGGYKVEPENIAGAIAISRLANIDFEDKSSREGLQENKTFQIFKQLILEIITVFEQDRSYIAREMLQLYNEINSAILNKEEAERLARSILEQKEKENKEEEQPEDNNENHSFEETETHTSYDSNKLYILAELNKEKDELIEKLEDEQKILRGLASSGIVIASFTHELGHLNDLMGSRIDDLKYLLSSKVAPDDYQDVQDFLNPFVYMENMKKQDLKMQNWLKFSLGSARKDKRKRRQIYLANYFDSLEETWTSVLANRQIKLTVTIGDQETNFRVFEIDLDSIFNNLIVNSIDAFILHKEIVDRQIMILCTHSEKEIIIDYFDNGPGLSKDIDNPEKIFDALFTTKRNKHTGEEEGTGLGMWLLNSIMKDNDGSRKLLFPEKGFGIRLVFPKKYQN